MNINENLLFQQAKIGKIEARNELVELYLPLVTKHAKKYPYCFEDAFQEGVIALIKAIENFQPHMKIKFTTFATPYIINHLKRFVMKNRLIHIPEYVQLKEKDNIDKSYSSAYSSDKCYDAAADKIDNFNDLVRELEPRSRKLIEERYKNNNTLTDIAKTFNISVVRAHQIEKKALKQIRDYI